MSSIPPNAVFYAVHFILFLKMFFGHTCVQYCTVTLSFLVKKMVFWLFSWGLCRGFELRPVLRCTNLPHTAKRHQSHTTKSVSTLTHWVGGLGFFQFRASPLMPWLGWIVWNFRGFCRQLFAHFPLPLLAHFLNVVFFFTMIWTFL